MTKLNIGAVLLAGAGAVGFAWTANAQTTPGNELSEVVVTGSRVITNGNDSPTPVTVVTVDDIQATRPTTVFEGLVDMPAFAGSRGATTNPANAGATNNNISALSLRGLGQQRTLILYDGKRVPPTQENGFVNANMIPQMLLQRVDVVTGGVSAVYGSDGISGVVNFISDRSFNGIKVQAQAGVSELNDDLSKQFGIAGGMDLFGGRGHLQGSYQWHDDNGILLRTARRFGVERWTLQGTGSAVTPYFMVPYATMSNLTFGGKITGPANHPLNNRHFVAPGVLASFNNGSTEGVIGNIQLGGDGAWHTSSSLKTQLEFHQLYGRFDFDVTDNLHYYATFAGSEENSFGYNTDKSLNNVTISGTNAFLPAAYQGATNFTFGKMWTLDSVPPDSADNETRQWWVNTGLEGKLGEYNWDVSYSRSEANLRNSTPAAIDNARLSAALDAVTSSGQIVCRVTVTNPGAYPGCVPINVFGRGTESPEAINYIMREAVFEPATILDDATASIVGAPFSSWAGPVDMALSGEWRKVVYELTSNSLPAQFDPIDCAGTGLRFNCNANTSKASIASYNRPPVSQTVTEVALEANVPLLTDKPFAQSISLNMAGRHAQYSQNGSPIIGQPNTTKTFDADTWKLGLVWDLNEQLTLRFTRSRDFRAPNLADLYAPGNISVAANFPDFLTGVTPIALLQTGGNPNLVPEIGNTATFGIVYRPTSEFSLTIDAYDITITDAIRTTNGYAPTVQDACYASGGSAFQCTLQERPVSIPTAIANPIAANTITKYFSAPINIAEQTSWGADIEANYKTRLFDHAFTLRGLVAYQPHAIVKVPGAPDEDFAGVDFSNQSQGGAVWRVSAFARYDLTERFTVDWLTRWRSALRHNSVETEIVGRGDPNHNPPVAFSNLNLSYKIGERMQGTIFFNVQNLFNQMPTPAASSGPQARPGNFGGYAPGDDPIGRYYTVGVRYRL